MSSGGSITFWIDQVKAGDPSAAQQLWARYFRRLVGLARKKLQDTPRQAADEEDVALSAFASFCQRAEQGQFPQLLDRNDLWNLLMVITLRKAIKQLKYERRQKRGGPRFGDEPRREEATGEEFTLEEIIDREPTPELAAQITEEYQRLLDTLGDAELRAIAVWKMEGETTEQIAARLQRAPRTIERRLQLIRQLWETEITS